MIKPIVKILAYTPEPEQVVASCAKLCYSSSSIDDLINKQTPESIAKFLSMLVKLGHYSPFEHVSFTFGIENVSRSLLAQLTRHRIASYSVQSQRYVEIDNFEFIIPPEIEKNSEIKEEYLNAMKQANEHYENILEKLKKIHLDRLLKSGIDIDEAKKIAEKKSLEDARFVLPNSCCTKIVCTMNARSLLNFFSLRCCNRAQWEIRELAMIMLKKVKKIAPNIFKYAGPPCVSDKCREGKMSCGAYKEVKKYFTDMEFGDESN